MSQNKPSLPENNHADDYAAEQVAYAHRADLLAAAWERAKLPRTARQIEAERSLGLIPSPGRSIHVDNGDRNRTSDAAKGGRGFPQGGR